MPVFRISRKPGQNRMKMKRRKSFLLLTDHLFHSIKMKSQTTRAIIRQKQPMLKGPAERRVSIIGYLGITISSERKQCCSTALIFRSRPFPIIQKKTAATGQTFLLQSPPYRLISSHLFPVIPEDRRCALPRWQSQPDLLPCEREHVCTLYRPGITPSLVCRKMMY